MREIAGDVLIGLGGLAVLVGVAGLFRFRDFTLRLLVGAKIDTVGLAAVVLGLCLRSGVTWFSAKALLVLAIVVVANPVVTSAIAAGHATQEGAAPGEEG